jgi:uridine kinase
VTFGQDDMAGRPGSTAADAEAERAVKLDVDPGMELAVDPVVQPRALPVGEPAAKPAVEPAGLVERIRAAPARLGGSRLVLIDGPSGAGKTTFAEQLAAALNREVFGDLELLHTDDLLDGWDGQFGYYERLERQVLAPVRRGQPGGYRCYDWSTGAFGGPVVPVRPASVLVVEGVGAAAGRLRAEASLSIFVSAPAEVCVARTLARDGAAMAPYLEIWRKREAEHFRADRTAEQVDVLVSEAPGLGPAGSAGIGPLGSSS